MTDDEPPEGAGRQEAQPSLEDVIASLAEATQDMPGIARIAAAGGLQSAIWAAEAGSRQARLLAKTLTDPESAGEFVEAVAADIAEAAHTVGGVARDIQKGRPVGEAVREALSTAATDWSGWLGGGPREAGPDEESVRRAEHDTDDLRERGAMLLERSRDVWSDEPVHPAFSRILDDLAPDEARILVWLARVGPAPTVDVRTGGPIGTVSSSLIAGGLSMIGSRSGCRYPAEVPAYLNNLFRLGLIWFSREQVHDPDEYQVVEAQPDVLEAMHSVRFAKVVRRSVHLTPFGEDFCRAAFIGDAPGPPLPEHRNPGDE